MFPCFLPRAAKIVRQEELKEKDIQGTTDASVIKIASLQVKDFTFLFLPTF